MEVKSSLDPRVIKPFCNLPGSASMGDVSASRPSNVRPRPLGEVKAESVCFDSPDASVLCVDNYERQFLQDSRMDRMHENLITTAIIGDVAAANSAPLSRRTPTAHGIPGSSFSSMQLISTLVSPISRTISIPKQRDNTTHRGILRINTAPSGFGKDKSMSDPCPSPASSESGLTDATTMSSGRGGKQTSTWGEYKRQISTAKRKEMCRRLTEMSKCEAEDMSDLMSRGSSRRPIMILSQMPQREKEYDQLVAKADVELQKKKTLPSVFLCKQKRPGSLVRETNVFSKALKNKPGYPVGDMEDMVVGRSVDPNYTDRQDDMGSVDSPDSEFGGMSSAGTRRSFSEMTNSRSGVAFYDVRLGGRHIPPKVSQSTPNTSRYRDKVLKLQGKSLPHVHTTRSENITSDPAPSERSRSPQHPHDARVLRELNAKCDRLQKQISVSLMAPDKVWSQNGYFNTNQPAPLTGPVIRQRRQPIHAIYRSFQRMHEAKPKDNRRYVPKQSGRDNVEEIKPVPDTPDSANDEVPPDLPETVDDENNNTIATKTFHLTEINDQDFLDSDSEEPISLSDSEEGDAPPPALLNPGEIDPIKFPSGNAKFQGPTSRISEDEARSQFHVVNGEGAVAQREAFKILKALDKDVYMDFEHRKYRRSGTHASLGQPDNPRVHFLKVKVTNTEG